MRVVFLYPFIQTNELNFKKGMKDLHHRWRYSKMIERYKYSSVWSGKSEKCFYNTTINFMNLI